MNTLTTFKIGVNKKIVGKCDHDKVSYKGAWQNASVTMSKLGQHISKGHPWMPGLLGGNGGRSAANVTSAAVMSLDFDDGFTIEQALAHPFIAAHAGLLIESSSSTPELHKFRVVFRLTAPIKGSAAVGAANRYFLSLFPQSDQSCQDASRFYFGGLGREPRLLNEAAQLPKSFATDALEWAEAEERKLAAQRAIKAQKAAQWLAENGEDGQNELIQSALDSIRPYAPGEGRYGELSAAIAGLCNDLGTAGEQMAIVWDGGRGNWGRPFEKWLASLLRSNSAKAGLGSLFHLAKREGWQRPRKAKGGKTVDRSAPRTQKSISKSAQLLENKLQLELTQWLKVAQEIAPNFVASDDAEKDIERAKSVVLSATARKVAYDKAVVNTGEKFTTEALDSLLSHTAPLFIGGATGGGKTELATQLAAHALSKDAGLAYGAIAPTQVLSVQVAERFESKGVPMESTTIITPKVEGERSRPKPKALPAESLWNLKGKGLDFLACDEPDQWVQRILAGTLGDAADVNLDVLKSLAQSVPHQFWLNADPSPITADLIESLSGQRPVLVDLQRSESKKPVSINFYQDGITETGNVICGDKTLYNDFMMDARQGKRVLLLAGSPDKARAIKKRLQKAGLRVLLKDGKYTPKKQRLGFAMKPEEVMQPYDVVILTRLVETGLDLQKDFDAVYVAVSPKMAARSVYQFLSRSRSLLRSDTPKLGIYNPSRTFTSVEQLSPTYWAEKMRDENRLYLSLLRGDTSNVAERLEAIDWAIEYKARYRADEARQCMFRAELLMEKFFALGWEIAEFISPCPGLTARVADEMNHEIYKAKRLQAHCTARGHHHITDYSEEYAEKLADPNEQGLILECKRRKLELSALLPDSNLENVDLIFRLQEDDRLLPQTLLRSAIALNPSGDRIQQLIQFLSNSHLEKMAVYGPLQGLKELKKSKAVLTLAIAELIGNSPLISRVLAGDDEFSSDLADVQEFAALLGKHSELINTWCRRYFGRDFSWDEDPTSVVCKALDKLLGIRSAATGQKSIKVDGKTQRPRVMRTSVSDEGRQAIAKAESKRNGESRAEVLSRIAGDVQQRHGLALSAEGGWRKRIDDAIACLQEVTAPLHTKSKTTSVDHVFSVQDELLLVPQSSPSPTTITVPDPEIDLAGYAAAIEYLDTHPNAVPIAA